MSSSRRPFIQHTEDLGRLGVEWANAREIECRYTGMSADELGQEYKSLKAQFGDQAPGTDNAVDVAHANLRLLNRMLMSHIHLSSSKRKPADLHAASPNTRRRIAVATRVRSAAYHGTRTDESNAQKYSCVCV